MAETTLPAQTVTFRRQLLFWLGEDRLLFGSDPHGVPIPDLFTGSIRITDTLAYPIYRLVVSGICLVLVAAMFALVAAPAWSVVSWRLSLRRCSRSVAPLGSIA